MNNPICKVTITDIDSNKAFYLNRINSITIVSSRKNFTDTAKIVLPRNIKVLNGNLNDILKRGSSVIIELGYEDGQPMQTEFIGYISRVDAQVPFTIQCEDEAWLLKQNMLSRTFKACKLKDIVSYIYPGEIQVIDMDLPSYRISRATSVGVLASLRQEYGITSYFKLGLLYVGFAYNLGTPNNVIFHLQQNVPTDGNKLVYRLAEDAKTGVTGVSILPGGKKIEYSVGDKTGATTALNFYGVSETTLKRLVNEAYKLYQIPGYTGSIDAFGKPYCVHGDIAHVIDDVYPEREGYFFIDETTTKFGVDGFRREITLGRNSALNSSFLNSEN